MQLFSILVDETTEGKGQLYMCLCGCIYNVGERLFIRKAASTSYNTA